MVTNKQSKDSPLPYGRLMITAYREEAELFRQSGKERAAAKLEQQATRLENLRKLHTKGVHA